MQFLRYLIWPISLVYGCISFIRNWCYDVGIFNVYIIPNKSICVGNLSTGGTGKTPHVAFIATHFQDQVETSILSRGYGRDTKGFILVSDISTANEVGDEPLFYQTIFKHKLHVAVCEKRKVGIEKLNQLFPSNELILLDDAFQHRAVKSGMNILLTDFNSLYSNDFMLPTGNLREWKSGRKRADFVFVTKCPEKLTESEKKSITKQLKFPEDKVFFSHVKYADLKPFGKEITSPKKVLLVTGIANPNPLLVHLKKNFEVHHINFNDHHAFSLKDIEEIHRKFDTFANNNSIIVTTEKDFMRLKDVATVWKLNEYPWYYQPISVEIDREEEFKTIINQYVNTI
ncbi:MAG: tetraacyldisaccharide 4'-kinase [Crocinitomicaceae bacterium]|nr:tetraacyldisaccharide 4'-kinase [Crocinitomicaceae bacterium]